MQRFCIELEFIFKFITDDEKDWKINLNRKNIIIIVHIECDINGTRYILLLLYNLTLIKTSFIAIINNLS